MKYSQIENLALRQWVIDYVDGKLEEHRKNHPRVEQLKSAWSAYSEADWEAWRRLLELRPRALEKFEQGEVDRAVLRKIDAQPRRDVAGQNYPTAYSFGLEVAALRELLGDSEREWPKTTTELVT